LIDNDLFITLQSNVAISDQAAKNRNGKT